MGTKIHYRSSFLGYDKMTDLNVDAGNNWPSFYVNKTLNEHFYNGCFPSCLNGYPEYDKEMLKRTMLEHEAIFRRQVYELHRLYNIQKELMEEFQKNGSSVFSKREVPSTTCSNQVQSESATRMLQISNLCTMNNSQKMEKVRYEDEIISPVNFLESNLQTSSTFLEIKALPLPRVAGPDASFRKCRKRMLDLRFPPGAYIDGTERSEEIDGSSSLNTITCSRICNVNSEIELKLNLANVSGSSGQEGVYKLNYHHNKSLFTDLADLNEPNIQTSVEGAPDSVPVQVFGPRTQTEENHWLNFPLSTASSLQNAFPKDGDYCERALSNVFQETKEKISRGTVCYNDADFTGNVCPINLNSSISHKEKKDPMFCEQQNHFQISGKCPGNSGFCNLGKLTSVFPDSFSTSLKLESNITPLPPVPTWIKSSGNEHHASIPFSAISSFHGSCKAKKMCTSDTTGSDLKSPLRFEEKFPSRLTFMNINLNVEAVTSFSGIQDGKCEDFLLKRRPACEPLEPSREVDFGFGKMVRVYERQPEDASCSLEDISKKKIIGPIFDEFQQCLVSSSNEEKLVIDELSLKKSISMDNNRGKIDLNSMFSFVDDPDFLDSSEKVQADAPSITEAAENIVKLSLDGFKHEDGIQRSGNALYLLAEMILSNNNSIELNSQPRDNGLDLFELMTLQLEEMKPRELWCGSREVENAAVDEKSKALLLVAKPRKAQGKKRRQRKEFQKDILPALASLSRQEVMEDIQAIGELMKASGAAHWKAGIRRRNVRGNVARAKACKKRRRRKAPVPITVGRINPPTPLFDVDRHGMIGWGRTTRRYRSARCPPISISTTLM